VSQRLRSVPEGRPSSKEGTPLVPSAPTGLAVVLARHCYGSVCLLDPEERTLWVSQEFDLETQRWAVSKALAEYESRTQGHRPSLSLIRGGASPRRTQRAPAAEGWPYPWA